MNNTAAIILAGGQGKRMNSELPKPMLEVLDEPMLEWVIKACENAGINDICVVKGYNGDVIDEYLCGRHETVLQEERKGTGHAVMMAVDWLKKRPDGNVIVLCGDAPFIDENTIKSALEYHIQNDNASTVITAKVEYPFGYGRIIRDNNGNGIRGIVEEKDTSDTQKLINEVNSGAHWFKINDLIFALGALKPNNSQNEYYLTDSVSILINAGLRADAYVTQNPNVVLGANDRKGLLKLNTVARMNIIDKHLDNGIEICCTDGISIGRNVQIGKGTKILQGTIIKGDTKIGEDCVIGPNCLIENCEIGDGNILNYVQAYDSAIENGVRIGPFVHLRPNSHIKSGVKIGDFVEVKNSVIGEKTSISHLTYVGDSDVGSSVNFGCGVATANYDGKNKFRTKIGDNAFLGCNTNLIAPVQVGDFAYTAAGSTVTKDIPNGALAIERSNTVIKEGYAINLLKKDNK